MAQPINDNIENAIVITGDGFTFSGSNAEATTQAGEPASPDDSGYYYSPGGNDDRGVWFVYTSPVDGAASFNTAGSTFDTTLTVFTSSDNGGSLDQIGYDDDGGSDLDSAISFPVAAGVTYWIRVSGYSSNFGDYVFTQGSGASGIDSSAIGGTPGNDVLGTPFDGAKTMTGGLGDDAYYVDSASDVVTEDANGGFDSIYTLVDYALPANVEKIVALGSTGLTLTGNALDNQLFGAAGADTLDGGLGDDRLDGRGGADRMVGGGGDDSYIVGDAGDVVVELAGEGYDTVYTTVTYTASANVEKIVARGSTGLQLTGNGSDNVITGGAGDDRLDGGAGADRINGGGGDDVLIGGAGKDVLTGGAGADLFVFAGVGDAGDTIADFQVGVDRVGLELAGFGLSGFDATMFESNARGLATGADTRFVYSENNGRLFFDADGSGAGKAVLLATLRGAPDLTADDFQVTSLIG